MMRNIVDYITISRVFFSLSLLIFPVFSPEFYVMYIAAGVTDVADGFLARRMGLESEFGSILDSAADVIFVAAVLITVVPALNLEMWVIMWISVIIMIKSFNVVSQYVLYRELVVTHTFLNKVTVLLIFFIPLTASFLDLDYVLTISCFIASLAVLQEIYLICTNKVTSRRDVKTANLKA